MILTSVGGYLRIYYALWHPGHFGKHNGTEFGESLSDRTSRLGYGGRWCKHACLLSPFTKWDIVLIFYLNRQLNACEKSEANSN